MTKAEKQNALNTPTIGYFSGWDGLEIKAIEYGINEFVIFVSGAFCGKRTVHRAKIYNTINNAYFIYNNHRISFRDIITSFWGEL